MMMMQCVIVNIYIMIIELSRGRAEKRAENRSSNVSAAGLWCANHYTVHYNNNPALYS